MHGRAVLRFARFERAPMRVQARDIWAGARGGCSEFVPSIARDELARQDAHEPGQHDQRRAHKRSMAAASCSIVARRDRSMALRRRACAGTPEIAGRLRARRRRAGRRTRQPRVKPIAGSRLRSTSARILLPRPEISTTIGSRPAARHAMTTPRVPARTSPITCALWPASLQDRRWPALHPPRQRERSCRCRN